MPIVDSIKKAREKGQSDEEILDEIIKQNEDKAPAFEKAKERGASATQIVDEIIEQNTPYSERKITKDMLEKENEEREQFLRKMDSREKGEPLEEEIPAPPEPKPIPEDSDQQEEPEDFKIPQQEEPQKENAPRPDDQSTEGPSSGPDDQFPGEPPSSSPDDQFPSSSSSDNDQMKGFGDTPEEVKKDPQFSQAMESMPEKPKDDDKMWIRIIVILALVAVVAIVLAFFYWALIMKPPTIEKHVIKPAFIEKEVSLPRAPVPLVDINPATDDSRRIAITTREDYIIKMSNIINEEIKEDLIHITTENQGEDPPEIVNLEDFFNFLDVRYPDDLFDVIEKDFTFFVYPEEEETRIGFMSRVKEDEERSISDTANELEWQVLRPWEKDIEEDLKELFLFLGSEIEENEKDLSQTRYDNHNIRYREIPTRERDAVEVTSSLSGVFKQKDREERIARISSGEYIVVDQDRGMYKIILEGDIEDYPEEEGDKVTTGWIRDVDVDFKEAFHENMGIYYTVAENLFIFTTSLEGMKEIINRI